MIIKLIEDHFKIPVKKEYSYLNNYYDSEIIIVRYFQGNIYKNSEVVPIQLEYHTKDIESTFEKLDDFAKENTSQFLTDGITYTKQNYGTPFVMQLFNDSGIDNTGIVSLNCTLTITENISDISKILVDDEDIYFDTADENYIALTDSSRKIKDYLDATIVRSGINKIIISGLSQNNGLLQKIRNIKRKIIKPDTTFKIDVYYNDSLEPIKYIMKLDSYSSSNASANIPFSTISFTE